MLRRVLQRDARVARTVERVLLADTVNTVLGTEDAAEYASIARRSQSEEGSDNAI